MNKINYKKIFAWLLPIVILLPVLTFAQSTNYNGGLQNPLKSEYSSLSGLMGGIINIVVEIGAIVAVFAIIWVGFLYVKAMGKPAEITKAHTALLWVCVGIAILVGAKVITSIVTNTINQIRA